MSLAERVAAEQVTYWRAEGVSLADCLETLYGRPPSRHKGYHGRTWADLERYLAQAWVDAVRWQRIKFSEAA